MKSKPVELPYDSMSIISFKDNNDYETNHATEFYWVVYSDSVDCATCRLHDLRYWDSFINQVNKATETVSFCFIFSPSEKDLKSFLCMAETFGYSNPIYLDSTNIFTRKNQHIPQGALFHTFLLDENKNVILVGDPVKNEKINKVFWNILDGNQ